MTVSTPLPCPVTFHVAGKPKPSTGSPSAVGACESEPISLLRRPLTAVFLLSAPPNPPSAELAIAAMPDLSETAHVTAMPAGCVYWWATAMPRFLSAPGVNPLELANASSAASNGASSILDEEKAACAAPIWAIWRCWFQSIVVHGEVPETRPVDSIRSYFDDTAMRPGPVRRIHGVLGDQRPNHPPDAGRACEFHA